MRIKKLLLINLLPLVSIRLLLFFISLITEYGNNTISDIIWGFTIDLDLMVTLVWPLLLLIYNYKLESKREKSFFILNFIFILISCQFGVLLSYLSWAISVGLKEDSGGILFSIYNPDDESIAITYLFALINAILTMLGSIFCIILLNLKNRSET